MLQPKLLWLCEGLSDPHHSPLPPCVCVLVRACVRESSSEALAKLCEALARACESLAKLGEALAMLFELLRKAGLSLPQECLQNASERPTSRFLGFG